MGRLSKIFSISFLIPFLCLTSCIERSPNYPPLDFVPQEGGGASLIFSGLPSAGIAGEELSSNLNVILEGLASADLSVKQTNSDATASNVNIALYRDSRCSIPVTLAPDGSPALIGYTPLPPINNRIELPHLAITKAQSLYIQANYQGTLSSCTPISILPSSFSSTYGKLVFSSDIFDIGEPVSVTYTAFDAYGNRNPSGISASSISFSVLSGGGGFTPTISLGDGVFTSTFVSPSEGGVLVTVTSSSSPAISSPIAVQVVSGVPYSISVGGGNNQSGAAGSVAAIPLSVKVLDVSQMPIYGDTVTWSVITGGGSFSSPTSTTNASGIAQVLYTYPTALGQNTLCATESIGGLFTYFTETSVPGPVDLAESIVSVTLSTITAGGSLLATLQTFDAYGNPSPAGITSASLIKIAGTGSGTFTQLGGSNGVYTATFGGTLAGTVSIGGLVNGSSVGSPVAVVTVLPGPINLVDATLTVSSYTVSAGSFVTATLIAHDAYGNANPSGITSASLTLTPGTDSGLLTQLGGSNGVYTATFGGTLAGTVSIGGLINGSSIGIPVDVVTVIPGPVVIADSIVTVTSFLVPVGNSITATLTAYDAYGNANPSGVSSGSLTLIPSPGDGILAQLGGSNGVYTATFGGTAIGSVTIGGLINGISAGTPVDVLVVVPGTATALAIQTCPSVVTAGSVQSFDVIAEDGAGDIITAYSGTVMLSSNDALAIFSPSTSQTVTTGGTVAFAVTLKTATTGGATFTARDNTYDLTVTCGGITVLPGPAVLADTTLTVSSSIVSAGNFITVTMTAYDIYGNKTSSGITSASFPLTPITGNGVLTQVSSVGGVYTATFGGTLVGTVSIGGLINGSSVATPIVVTVVPGTATSLIIQTCPTTVTAGNIQSIAVIAKDIDNNIATGYTGTVGMSSNDAKAVFSPSVSQTATTGGTLNFSVTLETATTGGTGGATFTARDSVHNLTVTCGGITVLPGLPTSIAITAPSMASKGGAFSAVVTAYDAYGNVATEDVSSVTLTSSALAVITPSSGAVLSAGTKTFSVTLNNTTVGKTVFLTATSGGFTATFGGIAVSFVTNVVYDTATLANYSVSPAGVIAFTASNVGLTSFSTPTFIDNSDIAAGFAGATWSGVTWGGADLNSTPAMLLRTSPAPPTVSFGGVTAYQGKLTSRTFHWSTSSSTSAGGVSLSWRANMPYTKGFPATSESINTYASLSSSTEMSGLIGLWHMDETSGALNDSSGNAGSMTLLSAGGGSISYGQPGILYNSVSLTKGYSSSGASCPSAGGVARILTLMAWINIPSSAFGTNMSIVSLDTSSLYSSGTASIQIYYSSATTAIQCIFKSASLGTFTLSTSLISGTWTHVACALDTNALGYQYINGVLFHSSSMGSLVTLVSPKIYIGKSDLPYTGMIDEIAILSAVPSAAIFLDFYRRGGNQLWFQLRGCPDAACAANPPFVGPDGTSSSYYTELENTSPQAYPTAASATVLTTVPNLLFSNFATAPQGTYVQYQATLTTMDTTSTNCRYGLSTFSWCSPALQAVTIGGLYYDAGTHDTVTTLAGVVTLSSPVAQLTGFSDTEGCATGGVLYNLSTNGSTWYYWNGAAWVTNPTGTLANANTAAVVNANIASFMTSGSLYIKAFLESNGATPCTLSNVQVQGYE